MILYAQTHFWLEDDSFENWRNPEHVGGRGIKRAINVGAASVKFLDDDDLAAHQGNGGPRSYCTVR